MSGGPRVGCFTFFGLTVASASGYTGYVGSRERIIPMDEVADVVLLMALCVLQILAAVAAGACALALRDQVRAGLLVPLWAVAGVCVVSVGGAMAQVATL